MLLVVQTDRRLRIELFLTVARMKMIILRLIPSLHQMAGYVRSIMLQSTTRIIERTFSWTGIKKWSLIPVLGI